MKSFLDFIKEVQGVRKILLAGAGGVGKTSLLKVLSEGKSLSEIENTGADLSYHRTLYLDLITVYASKLLDNLDQGGKFVFFDVAGQLHQPLHAVTHTTKSTMGGVDLIVLVFDGNNMQSLIDLGDWIETIKTSYRSVTEIPDFILIKNKLELPSNIDSGLIENFINSEFKIIKYFEISSLKGHGLKELQSWLVNYYFGEDNNE